MAAPEDTAARDLVIDVSDALGEPTQLAATWFPSRARCGAFSAVVAQALSGRGFNQPAAMMPSS